MTDEETRQLVQEAANAAVAAGSADLADVVRQVNGAIKSVDDRISALAALSARSLMNLAKAGGTTTAPARSPIPPPLGEIVVRLESGPASRTVRRIERDAAGNIRSIFDDPAA